MMGSAQLEFPGEELGDATAAAAVPPSALRQEAAERLAAHKQRRERQGAAEVTPEQTATRRPKHRAAAAVAERYAQTPSYRAFLAEQAKRAIEEAAVAAEIAVRNAEAVAVAQQQLLGELELWNTPQEFTVDTAVTIESAGPSQTKAVPERPAGLTVRLYEDLRQVPAMPHPVGAPGGPRGSRAAAGVDAEESLALDAEIAFRQSPVFEEFGVESEPAVLLPANLLEFPRQLVAARKARPRLAEGPLREEITARTAQLRIFEVEPEQISTAPAALPAAPEWTSTIRLDAHSVTEAHPANDAAVMPVLASLLAPQTAPLALRSMAAIVDAVLVAASGLACIAVYANLGGEIFLGIPAAVGTAGLLVILHAIYQALFFTLSDQTPGMRYARIGLCTFSDENPTRSAMRRRILAQFVAVCPLGLGLLWVLLDDDGLGWHDRISRMYQRAY